MSLFRAMRRVYGTVNPVFQNFIAVDIYSMVDEMLEAAVSMWAGEQWIRFDDREANCTIQLYRCAEDVIHRTATLHGLMVRLESVQPTPAMFSALESAERMTRPDIRVSFGYSTGITLECKRLSLSDGLPRKYVYEGMDRFVSGVYSKRESKAAMVGYMQGGGCDRLRSAVNAAVEGHPRMGASHRLHPVAPLSSIPDIYESLHDRSPDPRIVIIHYWLDLTPLTPA